MAMARRLRNQLFTAAIAGSGTLADPPTATSAIDRNQITQTWFARYRMPPIPIATNPSRMRRRGPHRSTAQPTHGIANEGSNPVNTPALKS